MNVLGGVAEPSTIATTRAEGEAGGRGELLRLRAGVGDGVGAGVAEHRLGIGERERHTAEGEPLTDRRLGRVDGGADGVDVADGGIDLERRHVAGDGRAVVAVGAVEVEAGRLQVVGGDAGAGERVGQRRRALVELIHRRRAGGGLRLHTDAEHRRVRRDGDRSLARDGDRAGDTAGGRRRLGRRATGADCDRAAAAPPAASVAARATAIAAAVGWSGDADGHGCRPPRVGSGRTGIRRRRVGGVVPDGVNR